MVPVTEYNVIGICLCSTGFANAFKKNFKQSNVSKNALSEGWWWCRDP